MPKSPRKRSPKRKVKKSKNRRKKKFDGTNDPIVKPEDVTLIILTKAQEFNELYGGESGKTLNFKSVTIKIGTYTRKFEHSSIPVTVRGEFLLKDGKEIYAFTFLGFTNSFFEHEYRQNFFEATDVVDFVQLK